jgi:hypothetical protein
VLGNAYTQQAVPSRMNPRKWDQRFELGNTEVIKSLLVIAGLGMGFFFLLGDSTGNCYETRPTD